LEFCNGGGARKTRMMLLPGCQKVWRCVHSFRDTILALDRLTDYFLPCNV